MTVQELIEELKKFPPDMEVRIWSDEDRRYDFICLGPTLRKDVYGEEFVGIN